MKGTFSARSQRPFAIVFNSSEHMELSRKQKIAEQTPRNCKLNAADNFHWRIQRKGVEGGSSSDYDASDVSSPPPGWLRWTNCKYSSRILNYIPIKRRQIIVCMVIIEWQMYSHRHHIRIKFQLNYWLHWIYAYGNNTDMIFQCSIFSFIIVPIRHKRKHALTSMMRFSYLFPCVLCAVDKNDSSY